MGLPEKRRRMHKVPENIREQSIQLFNPTIVSLGPYHHGKPELSRAESFKNDCLDSCTGGHVPRRTELYNVILQHIVEIKSCYADEVETFAKFADDKAVALMMLLDTCFIINFMANSLFWPGPNAQLEQININIPDNNDNRVANNTEDWIDFFGLTTSIQSVSTDIFLLENQVPFLAIRLLMDLLYDPETRTQLLERFIGWVISVDQNTRLKIPRAGQEAPIHLLEAFWREMEERRKEIEKEEMRDSIPVPQKERKPLTEVQEFNLHVDNRAVDRAEFDKKENRLNLERTGTRGSKIDKKRRRYEQTKKR